jgi:hypothetical protein
MFGGSNWWDAGCSHCGRPRTASPGAYAGEGARELDRFGTPALPTLLKSTTHISLDPSKGLLAKDASWTSSKHPSNGIRLSLAAPMS